MAEIRFVPLSNSVSLQELPSNSTTLRGTVKINCRYKAPKFEIGPLEIELICCHLYQ